MTTGTRLDLKVRLEILLKKSFIGYTLKGAKLLFMMLQTQRWLVENSCEIGLRRKRVSKPFLSKAFAQIQVIIFYLTGRAFRSKYQDEATGS
jgi:hypothetical protein